MTTKEKHEDICENTCSDSTDSKLIEYETTTGFHDHQKELMRINVEYCDLSRSMRISVESIQISTGWYLMRGG